MKEIGGFFEIENTPTTDNEFHYNCYRINTARNALAFLIREKHIKKIFLPFYLCDCVKNTCINEGCACCFYRIDSNMLPIIDWNTIGNDYLYIVNYYGLISDSFFLNIKKICPNIIVDNVHAFFRKPLNGIDTIYSCRKFFGVPDGAYLFTESKFDFYLKVDDSSTRLEHLYGRKKRSAFEYFDKYRASEKELDYLEPRKMSTFTADIMKKIDYASCRKKREINFAYLHKHLCKYNKIVIEDVANIPGPFSYPFEIENAEAIRDILIQNKIYIPLLWKEAIHFGENEEAFSRLILPIPCDQRYNIDDMERIISTIKLSL